MHEVTHNTLLQEKTSKSIIYVISIDKTPQKITFSFGDFVTCTCIVFSKDRQPKLWNKFYVILEHWNVLS